MTALFETLAIKDGEIIRPEYHNARLKKGTQFLGVQPFLVQSVVESYGRLGFWRCRIDYNQTDITVDYCAYHPKIIRRFGVVVDDFIDYSYKYSNRDYFNQLLAQKNTCDEVIIIKNGNVSDCTIGNLLFFKQGRWYTPDTPLLYGTQRQFLLDNRQIIAAPIKVQDIITYEKIMMINALNDFDPRRALSIKQSVIFG